MIGWSWGKSFLRFRRTGGIRFCSGSPRQPIKNSDICPGVPLEKRAFAARVRPRMSLASLINANPAGVSSTDRVVRTKSLVFSSVSREWI